MNCTNNKVILAGADCPITACSISSLTCTIGKAPSAALVAPFSTSRGLLNRVWYGQTNFNLMTSQAPSAILVQAEAGLGFGAEISDNYMQSLDGYFVPKVSAWHTFYLHGDDNCDLKISFNGLASNLTTIATVNVAFDYYARTTAAGVNGGQISQPFYLTAGQKYLLNARQNEGYIFCNAWGFLFLFFLFFFVGSCLVF